MAESKQTPFFELTPPRTDGHLSVCSLVPAWYEREIAEQNGHLDLGDRAQLSSLDDKHLETYRRLVPSFRREDTPRTLRELEDLLLKFSGISGTTSLLVRNSEEFLLHALRIYQVSHANYVLEVNKHPAVFPKNGCGNSSLNLLVYLLHHGYPMAAIASNKTHDHSYNFMPFVLQSTHEDGIIVFDSTSDQLWTRLPQKPRNTVFIVSNRNWSYHTHWKEGGELYPERILNLQSLRTMFRREKEVEENEYQTRGWNLEYETDAHRYVALFFSEAFAHPLSVDL